MEWQFAEYCAWNSNLPAARRQARNRHRRRFRQGHRRRAHDGKPRSFTARPASVGHDLTELMKRVNSLVYEASSPNRYATLFYAEYDPRSRQLSYVNAGHNPPVILRKSAAACRVFRLETGGPVIGIIRQCYQQGSFPLEPGDLVVLFTDGVPESMNVRDEEWGEDRLIEFAKTCHDLPAFEAMTRILAAAEAFTGGASQHDDMTLVVLRVLT